MTAVASTPANPPPRFSTPAAFFDWYRHQEGRYEWVDGIAVAMAGPSPRHGAIEVNLIQAIGEAVGFIRGLKRELRAIDSELASE